MFTQTLIRASLTEVTLCVLLLVTLTFLLRHDRVAQGQQAEELLHQWLLQFHSFNQTAIIKLKPAVSEGVEGKVYAGCFLWKQTNITEIIL